VKGKKKKTSSYLNFTLKVEMLLLFFNEIDIKRLDQEIVISNNFLVLDKKNGYYQIDERDDKRQA
jgi:hypothetical protein